MIEPRMMTGNKIHWGLHAEFSECPRVGCEPVYVMNAIAQKDEGLEQEVRKIVDRHVRLDYDDYPTSCSPYSIAQDVAAFIHTRLADCEAETRAIALRDAAVEFHKIRAADLAAAEAARDNYEREYILPCFTWARELGIDLQKLVLDNPGHNCVELLVKHLPEKVRREALEEAAKIVDGWGGSQSRIAPAIRALAERPAERDE